MRSIFTTVAVAAMLIGCSRSTVTVDEPAAVRPVEVRPHEHTRLRAPYLLTVEGPESAAAGEVVKVVALLELAAPAPAPIVMSLEVPDGAMDRDGILAEELPAGTQGTVERSWELRVVDPKAVVTVTAQMKGEGFGATARRELSFAGPADAGAPPARPGALLRPAD